MILLIGGPPRVGKTILTKQLAQKLGWSWTSTDSIRQAVKNMDIIPKDNPLYIHNYLEEETNPEKYYSERTIEEIAKNQNIESKEVIKAVIGFIEGVQYNNQNIIIEGVALLPHLLPTKILNDKTIKYFVIGNKNYDDLFKYSWENRSDGDWLENASQKLFKKVICLVVVLSEIFKKQARDKNITYYEISSKNFHKNLENIQLQTQTLLKTK